MVAIGCLIALGVLVLLVAAIWGFHRLCLLLEERGYIYYRKRPEGGGSVAGVFLEMDRLSRPSMEHVIAVQDTSTNVERQEIDGD